MRSRNRTLATGSSRGFSLVELMIALVIGLVVVASASAVFVSSRQTFRTQESLAQVQEAGRYLQFVLYPYIRQAGYLPDPLVQTDPARYFVGTPHAAGDLRRALWGADDVAGSIAGVTPEPGTDVIVSRYFGQDGLQDPLDLQGQLKSCRGLPAGLAGLAPGQMAENVFFVRPWDGQDASVGDSGIGSLSCRARVYSFDGSGTVTATQNLPSQPLVLGVQDMQVLYGFDSDADGAPNRYLSASGVVDWQAIVSVRIAVTVVGGNATELMFGNAVNMSTGETRIVDGRLQRRFTTTLQIRNLLRS